MFKKTGLVLMAVTGLVACGGGDDGGTDAGGGGAPLCTSSGKNAFDTYQMAGFSAVVSNVALNVEADLQGSDGLTNLGDSFTKAGSAANGSDYADGTDVFLNKLTAFLIFAYGGPSTTVIGGTTFDGNIDMVAAHTGMNITSAQYDYFITNDVVPALVASHVGSDDISSCFAPVVTNASFKASIVGH